MFYISFFKEFKDWNHLSINEKIVYSFLVNYATMHQKDSWDKSSMRENEEKRLNMNLIKEFIDEHQYLEFRKITYRKIRIRTRISLRTISTIVNRFKDLAILSERDDYYKIIIPKGFIDKGFLTLPENTGLKGMQLVFWAFLNERLRCYNNKKYTSYNTDNKELDTWASRLASDMGVKKKDVQNYIHCLTKRDFLKRSEDGKRLFINIHKNLPRNPYVNSYTNSESQDFYQPRYNNSMFDNDPF